MRQFLVVSGICWLSLCNANAPNTLPLAFGMTPEEAANALGLPLDYVTGRHGDDVYVVDTNARTPGFYLVGEHIYLKFRKDHLTGWKYDWRLRPHFPF
jgi:hypothetical protein